MMVSTFAGKTDFPNQLPFIAYADGQGTNARFWTPYSLAFSSNGTLYVADADNNVIRAITPGGLVSTFATGFNRPTGVAFSSDGKLYVTDSNQRVCAITTDGVVSTFATLTGRSPTGVAVSPINGTIYVTDFKYHEIIAITPTGVVSVLAGKFYTSGVEDGQGSNAKFDRPISLTVSPDGTIYVADTYNNRIRTITPGGLVSTLAGSYQGFADGQGTEANFNRPFGVSIFPDGNIYVADTYNSRIRAITPGGLVSTFAGKWWDPGVTTTVNGAINIATFNTPSDMLVSPIDGTIYVSDLNGNHIRAITSIT